MTRINDKDVDNVLEFVDVDNAGGPVYHYKGKLFTGIIESFYGNGTLHDEAEFTNGHIGGVQRKYYENGQMEEEYYKYFGKLDKHYKQWDENGNLIRHSIWKEGELIKRVIS
jgi:antitoxin component YwqK of YwqJK toxin-antitoxin module